MNTTAPNQASTAPLSQAAPVLAATFVLAFCSIVYELLLGQTLSAFLGNTVLRYSVTIGLYLFSMGMGALIAGDRVLRSPVRSLQAVEILLTVVGATSIPFLLMIDVADLPVLVLSLVAHALIILIGILTGLEIPLMIEMLSRDRETPGQVLGVDYAGAFAGTIAFALFFYPTLGIFKTALVVASLNAVVGVVLPLSQRALAGRDIDVRLVVVQLVLLAGLAAALAQSAVLEETGIGLYIAD